MLVQVPYYSFILKWPRPRHRVLLNVVRDPPPVLVQVSFIYFLNGRDSGTESAHRRGGISSCPGSGIIHFFLNGRDPGTESAHRG